jgi:hypothetical protein
MLHRNFACHLPENTVSYLKNCQYILPKRWLPPTKLYGIATCRLISRQRPKYTYTIMKVDSLEMFCMWFAYIHCWLTGQ